MLKFFRIPFASSGDKTAVPDTVDASGYVSYPEGYGFDYQRDGATDPAAKNIERDKMNQVFYDLTQAVSELQAQGVPDFIDSTLNGGTAYSYGLNALVMYSGSIYISLAASNTATPTDATKWALIPTPQRVRDGANVVAASVGGTSDAITITLTPTQTAFAPGPTYWRAAAANSTTTPTLKRDGLAAKTIVKGNNVPLAASDIPGAGAWMCSQYDATLDKEVLLNPATGVAKASAASIQGAFKNLKASATGTNSTVTVSADEIAVEDSSNAYKTLRTVSLSINSAAAGENGLDTGALAASTWYAVWVIHNPATQTTAGLLSLSANAPTMPAGYTMMARVGWIRTDGTANKYPLSFIQYGRDVQYKISAGSNVTALPVMVSGTATWWTAVGVSAFVPPTACRIFGFVNQTNGNALSQAQLAPNSSWNTTGTGQSGGFGTNAVPSVGNYGNYLFDMMLESTNVYWGSSGSADSAQCRGWTDNF